MRFALFALLVVLLAGCADDATTSDDGAPGDDGSSNVPSASPPMKRTYQNQTLGAFDVQVVMGVPAAFDVEIPDHAIDVTVDAAFVVATMVTLTVDIEECGAAEFPGVTASAVGDLGSMLACAGGSPGSHHATVTVDAGAFVGTITVTARVPT